MIENREQQIKSASEIIAYGCSDELKAALIQDFPELAESEGERMMKFLKDYAIEMIAGLESDISISVYDGVKGHDPEAEAELEKWKGARAWLEKQKEQKPALRLVGDGFYSDPNSHFELEGEQKPAEWSEEDRNMVAQYLRDRNEKMLWPEAEKIASDILDRLRPQPHWKPSEEQMDALKNSAYGTYQNGDGPVLRELYEQLKKLM